MIKYKVIENDMPHFENDLNEFASQNNIEIIDIKYSTSATPPDDNQGWCTIHYHNALITYKEQ